jgi:nicotinate-nucleotide adenylyltransferase
LRLEKVFLIPSASPPHKTKEPVTSFRHRLAMARLAVGESTRIEVKDLEGRRAGLSYSIETLREFHAAYGSDVQLFFILGMDAFVEINTWREYQKLFDLAHFVVIRRPGSSPNDMQSVLLSFGLRASQTPDPGTFTLSSGKSLMLRSTTFIDVSSTRIRQLAGTGKSIRFLLPDSVMEYIGENGLYRNYGNPR